jgi:nucleoside-diphosphate-sugar epimerase
MSTPKILLITGAHGFVGTALSFALAGLHRQTRGAIRTQNQAGDGDTVAIGNIDEHTDWRQALHGVDSVIHLAGRAHIMRDIAADPLTEYRRINVDGTVKLARDAATQGVRRLIFLSSVKVHGERSREDHPFSENDAPHPEDAYGRSKLEAEQALRRIADDTGLEVVVLRPPLVYGPGVKGNFLQLLGMPLPLASINNRRSLVYVGNLVDAIISCMDTQAAAGKTFLVSDGEDVSTPALVRKLAAALGNSPLLLPCPPALLHSGAALLGKRAAAMRLTGSLAVDSTHLRQELGWQPRYSLDQGLSATAQWYHQSQN